MKWYISKIVYEIICGDGQHTAQFDEQLRLVQAEDLADAFQLAISIGRQEEMSFHNDKQQLVQWKFIAVPELFPIEHFIHGAEVFSRICEVDQAQEYKAVLHSRSNRLSQIQPTCQQYHFLT